MIRSVKKQRSTFHPAYVRRAAEFLGIAFRADITVSMECVKLGCELFPGKLYAGETVSVPIGIDLSFFEKNKMYVLHMIRKIFLCFCQNEQRILTKEIMEKF